MARCRPFTSYGARRRCRSEATRANFRRATPSTSSGRSEKRCSSAPRVPTRRGRTPRSRKPTPEEHSRAILSWPKRSSVSGPAYRSRSSSIWRGSPTSHDRTPRARHSCSPTAKTHETRLGSSSTHLPRWSRPTPPSSPADADMSRTGYDEVTLLTGFPTLLARRLAWHILETEPRTLVYAVVRPKFADDAQQFASIWPKSHRDRFVMIEGDAAAMDLGLSGAEFRSLASEVDRIHHAAHVTYLGVDQKTAQDLNVGGTNEILELARASRSLKCLVVHSTTEVCGDRTGIVLEEELEAGQHFPTFVAETRARAEKLARRAMSELPIAIVRPATIVGDSKTGEIDRVDGPYLLILLIVTAPAEIAVPLPARGDTPLNIVPIDFVVRASHAIGRDPRAPGRTFHLVDPTPVNAKRGFDL